MELDARTVVLVEGVSDRHAVEALAQRQGRDLAGEGVAVVAMGGAQAIGRFLELYGPRGRALELATAPRLAGGCASSACSSAAALHRSAIAARASVSDHPTSSWPVSAT